MESWALRIPIWKMRFGRIPLALICLGNPGELPARGNYLNEVTRLVCRYEYPDGIN